MPPRDGQGAGGVRRVAENFVEHRRGQRHGRQQHETHGEKDDRRQHEVAIPEQALVEEMHLGGQHVHDEQVQPQHTGQRFDPDFGRGEPVQALTAVEQHLQADQAQGEGAEAEEVERRRFLGLFLGQQQCHHQKDVRRQRKADVEHRAPAEVLADPAADARAADDAQEHDGGPASRQISCASRGGSVSRAIAIDSGASTPLAMP